MLLYILYILISPILWIIIFIASFFNKKINSHRNNYKKVFYKLKFHLKHNVNNKIIILFHASSAGEFEQLKPILKKIDKQKYFIIQSFSSPTVYDREFNSNLFNISCYHALDFPWSAYKFLKIIKPKYYIITRHDIWPNHIFFAKKFKITTILINANLYSKSTRLLFGSKYFNKWLFSNFNKIITGSERLKFNLEKIAPASNIKCIGDSRFDGIKERSKETNIEYFHKNIYDSENIIFGSILLSDLNIIFNSLKISYPQGEDSLIDKNHRLLIVPHEIDEIFIKKIEYLCNKQNLFPIRYTKIINMKILPNVIIVDKIGILADLYKYTILSYIGGGFCKGVHSVIEPSVYGSVVSFGTNIDILDEAIEMHNNKIGFMVKNSNELSSFYNFLNKKNDLEQKQLKTFEYVNNKINCSQLILDEILTNENYIN